MPAPLIPRAETLQLMRGGATEGEILAWLASRHIHVKKSALTAFRRRNGIEHSKRGTKAHTGLLPWQVRKEHADHLTAKALRYESRTRRGEQLAPRYERERQALHRRLAKLEEDTGRRHVVTYDPDTGFTFVPARPGDTDLIRVPDPE